jgi:hypothetical protein
MNRIALTLAAAALAGCASLEVYRIEPARSHRVQSAGSGIGACARLLEAIDSAVDSAEVGDALASRIAGFPYLRASRFLASFAGEPLSEAAFAEWVERMRRLDEEARSIEVANLPPAAHKGLLAAVPAPFRADLPTWMRECSKVLKYADLDDEQARALLSAAAVVPPDYQTWKRVLGVYWLVRPVFATGVRKYQAETLEKFASEAPSAGRRVRYAMAPAQTASAADLAAILGRGAADPLGVPEPSAAELAPLFATYAPQFEVDEVGADDRIGAPGFGEDGGLRVDSASPTVYTRLAWTRFAGRALPQLVYSVWFQSRPPGSSGEAPGGPLDSLVWRVTLGLDGEPLVFDTMHGSGLHHQFIPTARVSARPQPVTFDDTLFAPQTLPRVRVGDRIVLRVAARTHFLQRVLVNAPAGGETKSCAFAPDDGLRSLPSGKGRRSAFGTDAIIAGKAPAEHVFLWPVGIREPGAMREWGHHATAVAGMRHFDDADLFEKYFKMAE